MKKILLIVMIAVFAYSAMAQKDQKAKAILDAVSKQTKTYKTIKIKFLYILQNTQENVVDTTKGTIYIKGNKYKLFFMGNEIFSDGKTIWTHLIADEELTISEPNQENEQVLNPAKVLTIYESGFKYQYVGETSQAGSMLQQINLFPEKPKEKKYSSIKLLIDKSKKQIFALQTRNKDGINYTIQITQFKPNVKVIESMFTFDKNRPQYKGVYVIDEREN